MTSLYLSLTIVSLLGVSSSVLSAEWLDCGPPKTFEVELEDQRKISVYDSEIKVKYNRVELAVYDYAGLDVVNFLINNTVISFSGHLVKENEQFDPNAFKTSRIFNSQIAGSAKLIQSRSNDNALTDCNTYLSRNRNEEEINLPNKLQVEIIHEAASCVKSFLCQRLGTVAPEDMKRAKNNPFEFGILSVLLGSGILRKDNSKAGASSFNGKPKININDVKSLISAYDKSDSNSVNRNELQLTINELVDLAIAEIVKKMQEENQGRINIPDLNQNFSTGSSWWKITGEFNGYKGIFEDLTTLSRTEDAVLSHSGLKYIASCGFGLSKVYMQYEKYKLRYGIIKISGKLSANVDGVALAASVAVDYNQKPCRIILQDLRVSKLGKVKVNITGLGPLNKLLSKLVTWITIKWQEEIVKKIEDKLKDVILKNLNKFNCEKYRP